MLPDCPVPVIYVLFFRWALGRGRPVACMLLHDPGQEVSGNVRPEPLTGAPHDLLPTA